MATVWLLTANLTEFEHRVLTCAPFHPSAANLGHNIHLNRCIMSCLPGQFRNMQSAVGSKLHAYRTSTPVFGDGHISTHADPTSKHRGELVESPTGTFIVLHARADSSDFGLVGRSKSHKNGKFPPRHVRRTAVQNLTLASFILGGEIRNRTNKQNYKQ